ncbi:MAG: hypothetical protein NVS4B7_20070 [Ktedonobacteraceae bacterium]
MKSKTPFSVNLEVTVPRIAFAASKSPGEQRETRPVGSTSEDEEQVRLSSIGEQQQIISSETSAHIIHAIRFHMFRLQFTLVGRPLLLQVLRRWKKPTKEDQRKENTSIEDYERLYTTAASAFTVEFRSQSDTDEKMPSGRGGQALWPGLNHIIIYLDTEGTPSNYSIDGAQG